MLGIRTEHEIEALVEQGLDSLFGLLGKPVLILLEKFVPHFKANLTLFLTALFYRYLNLGVGDRLEFPEVDQIVDTSYIDEQENEIERMESAIVELQDKIDELQDKIDEQFVDVIDVYQFIRAKLNQAIRNKLNYQKEHGVNYHYSLGAETWSRTILDHYDSSFNKYPEFRRKKYGKT